MTADTTDLAPPPIHPHRLRDVLGHFCSGVTIVTAANEHGLLGLTCQSFFSLSLDPPLIAFSPSKQSTTYPRMRSARSLCINVLAHTQADLCRQFGRPGAEKFRDVDWREGPSGAPILHGALAWLECSVHAEHDAGDHHLVIARVLDLDIAGGMPLLFYRGAYHALATPMENA